MDTKQSKEHRPQDERASDLTRRAWKQPELIQYGSFRKLTQSRAGSTGESGNFTMRSTCL
jgi:hypothetical protein